MADERAQDKCRPTVRLILTQWARWLGRCPQNLDPVLPIQQNTLLSVPNAGWIAVKKEVSSTSLAPVLNFTIIGQQCISTAAIMLQSGRQG